MSEKASILSSNVVWVAGIVVAMGVSVYALVASGVLDGSDQTPVDDTAAVQTPAPNTQPSEDKAADNATEVASNTEAKEEKDVSEQSVGADSSSEDPDGGAEAASPVSGAESATDAGEAAASDSGTDVSSASPESPKEAPAVQDIIAPSFDVVRIDAEGNTVVAGTAAPDAMLSVLLDGEEIALAPADITGKFAAILTIEPSEAPRVLSLVERREEGDVPSDATVIVAPVISIAQETPQTVPAQTEVASDTSKVSEAVSESVAEASDGTAGNDTQSQALAETAEQSGTATTEAADTVSAEASTAAAATATQDAETAVTAAAPEAAKAPAVIVSDSEGVRVVQAPAASDTAPEVLANVSIDSISYSDAGAVNVSGRGNPGAFVRLYLDNQLTATTQIGDAGLWATQLNEVAGGIYDLRADEVDSEGKVQSRILTPFKRETPETVAKARAMAEAQTETAAAVEDAEPSPETTSASDDAPAQEAKTAETAMVAEAAPTSATEETVVVSQASQDAASDAADGGVAEEAAPAEDSATQAAKTTPTPDAPAQQPAEASNAETASEATPVDTAEAASAPVTAATEESDAAPEPSTEDTPQAPVRIVTVQPGSTLWAIARDRYGEGEMYVRVFEANKDKIRDPDLIYPGQVFSVPEE